MRKIKIFTLICSALLIVACAPPMKVEDVSFIPPSSIQGCQNLEGLEIAVEPIDSLHESENIFHTDLKEAQVLPVHIIVQNTGNKEFEINHQQMFGILPNGRYQVAFTLDNAANKIRNSSIGTTAVTQTVAGAALGAAVGAGVGAGIGYAAGDTGTGAGAGAIIGGTTGAVAGLGDGVSDRWTFEFKKQLTTHAFQDRVIYPGDIQQGFIYLRWNKYKKLRMKIFNISDNTTKEMVFPMYVER
ncbi:MAG: hypothetical protein PHO79_01190 [Desulfoplanes sp.]|nr:hypothetical protein [Desulfoplanes sp.]MDD4648624.1 hypothetical protein [Desulfoplanes sp.]